LPLFDDDRSMRRPKKPDIVKAFPEAEARKDLENMCSNREELVGPHFNDEWWSSSS